MSQAAKSNARARPALLRGWRREARTTRIRHGLVVIPVAVLYALGSVALGPAPANAAPPTVPTVTLTGKLIQLADQKGPQLAAIRTADNQLVPVEATTVKRLKSGSAVTLNVVVPMKVRAVAAADSTLTVRGPNGKVTSTSLDSGDLAAASDGTPETARSDLGRATVASAASTGQALAVSAVVAAADPVATYTPATRHLFVAVVTPLGWATPNPVTPTQISAQVTGASAYWSTVTGGGVKLDVATTSALYSSAYDCSNPWGMWTEAAASTGFASASNTSLVVELPPGISNTKSSGCGYGLGTIGANVNDSGMAYVSDDVFPVLSHELGHNMSLQHADTLQCPSASDSAFNGTSWAGTGCTEASYGDGDDVMSASPSNFAPFLSSPQSLRTGIISPDAATVISTPGTTSVTLNALGGRTGIRVAEVADPTNDVNYYVEYRVPTAPDTPNVYSGALGVHSDALGVRVLRFNPATGTTVQLDPTPPSTALGDTDATLHVGATFTSYSGAVHVTTLLTTSTTATVSITIGPTLGGFTGQTPARVLDTRTSVGGHPSKLGAGATMTLTVPGLPVGATAVALNVTVTGPTASSNLTVFPGGTRPNTSNLNYLAGQTIPNMVLVPLGSGNTIQLYNSAGTVNVIVDLVGSFAP